MSKDVKCTMCQEECSGKLNIEVRKGKLYPFCTACFGLWGPVDNKILRKKIKENRYI